MKNIYFFVVLAFLATSIQSCKKDKTDDPTPVAKQCRMTAATVSSTSSPSITYSFSYNNDKRVSQIISSASPAITQTFTYSGNTIVIIRESGTTQTGKTVITTNAAGRQLRSEERDVNNDTLKSSRDFEYTSNGDLLKQTSNSVGSAPTITNVSFTNGNMTSINGSGNVTTLGYYSDQSFRIGDYYHLVQMLQTGTAFFVVNKNLIKSLIQGSTIQNFDYFFDADNNITQCKITSGSDITTVDIQQVCE